MEEVAMTPADNGIGSGVTEAAPVPGPADGDGAGAGLVEDSLASIAEATDPSSEDPFVELGLVDSQRWAAPGGWRRIAVGGAVGVVAGWLVVSAHHRDIRTDEARP